MITLEEGSVIAGRYRLDRELARGGMGAVWVAQHLQLDVAVAIKFMDPAFAASADARARFEREAKAAAKLQSPNVVQVHDYGVENGMLFIAMELLQGEDLATRLKDEGKLSLRATAPIVVQVAKASDATKAGESTKTGTLIGSPHYMSPEQARGSKQLDFRSDIWSLGVIVFRMITGQLPFPGDEIGEVIMAICADPIPVPSQIAPHLGPEVDRFFERALARDVTKRFQSARELAEAFTALAAEEGGAGKASWSNRPPAMSATGSSLPGEPSAQTPREISVNTGAGPSRPDRPSDPGSAASGSSGVRAPGNGDVDATAKTAISAGDLAPAAAQAIHGTLAPTGNSLAEAPKRGSRTALFVGIGIACLVVVGAVVALRPSAPAGSSAAVGATIATNVPSAAPTEAPPPAVTATATATATVTATAASSAPEPVASASASASASPSASAAAGSPTQAPGVQKAPTGKAALPAGKKDKNSVLGF
jgi:hypothetical protein